MMNVIRTFGMALLLAVSSGTALADEYDDTVKLFKDAGQSATFFGNSYGYAVFPTIGKAGLGVGGAHGDGRVYAGGKYVGDTSMTQLSFGAQAGGQAFSQIVFLQDKRAFDEFTSGRFRVWRGRGGRSDHCRSFGRRQHGWLERWRERRQERRDHRGFLQQRHGRLHGRQGWLDVRSLRQRPEVQVQGTLSVRRDSRNCGGNRR